MSHFAKAPAKTVFHNYVKVDPDSTGNRMQPAALIEADAVEYVKKYWNLPEAQAGQYLLMHPAGKGTLMSATNFLAKYTEAHTTA